MPSRRETPFSPMNAVMASAGIFFGVVVGYVIAAGQVQPAGGHMVSPDDHVHTSAPAAGLANEQEIKAYRDILANDPQNLKANVELGNRLYDAGHFAEAVPYYERALSVDPKNVNVSTDLGTALYYAGRTDEALAQLEKSATIDPAHGQTLFNIGIIRRDGKKDPTGAVAAWTRLLEVAPDYPEAARVRTLIAETQKKG